MEMHSRFTDTACDITKDPGCMGRLLLEMTDLCCASVHCQSSCKHELKCIIVCVIDTSLSSTQLCHPPYVGNASVKY